MIYVILVILVLFQFLLPALARKVKGCFTRSGVNMAADPSSAWLNNSEFWKEAKKLNETHNNKEVSTYLLYYNLWWIVVILCAVLLLFSGV